MIRLIIRFLKTEKLVYDLVGTTFDRVRVEIRLVRLSINGTKGSHFFLPSIIILGLFFDFDGGGFSVSADEHVDEFDLQS